MSPLTIEFAGARYRFAGLNPEQDGLVRARFRALLCRDDAEPDVRIDIHFDPNSAAFMRKPPGPVEYPLALAPGDESIAVAGAGFTANIDRSPLRAQMQTCLSDDWFAAAFENLFRIIACHQLFNEGALVMHSAAFTDGARGFLFCGRSGAGKTTLCGLADALDLEILSDELNAIRPRGRSFELLAMPFAGDFGGEPRRHPPYPLTGLLGLRQGGATSLSLCSKAEAVSRIVASCPYLNADPRLVDELTSRAEQLAERQALRVLEFTKDTSFWKALDDEYREPATAVSR